MTCKQITPYTWLIQIPIDQVLQDDQVNITSLNSYINEALDIILEHTSSHVFLAPPEIMPPNMFILAEAAPSQYIGWSFAYDKAEYAAMAYQKAVGQGFDVQCIFADKIYCIADISTQESFFSSISVQDCFLEYYGESVDYTALCVVMEHNSFATKDAIQQFCSLFVV